MTLSEKRAISGAKGGNAHHKVRGRQGWTPEKRRLVAVRAGLASAAKRAAKEKTDSVN